LLNVSGYYDTLLTFLHESERLGLMTAEQLSLLQIRNEPVALLDELGHLAPLASAPDDYRRI